MGGPTKSPAKASSWWKRVRAPVTALTAYAVLAVALFSDTWRHPTTWSIGVNTGDPQLLMWNLSWPMFAIAHGDSLLFTNYQFYPAGVNLMWDSPMLVPALVLSPVTWFGGPVLAYNVLATAALALSAWTGFLLIRRFVSSQLAAAVGGVLYGFSPYMTAHSLGHPVLTAAFMPPIVLLLLDDAIRVQRRPPAVSGLLLGLAGVAQLLIGEELLVTTAIVATLMLWLCVALRPDVVRSKLKYTLVALGCASVVFVVLAAGPTIYQLAGPRRIQGLVHPLNVHVSDALSFFVPTRLIMLAPDRAAAISDKFSGGVVEVNSYVGVLLVALLVFIAVRYWRRLIVRLATTGALLIAILSMGVTIHYAGNTGTLPVFTLGLAFPLLQRFMPGRLMLYLTFLGWLALSQLPLLGNVLPTRLMLYFYLLAGLLLAVFLDDVIAWKPLPKALGFIAAAASLLTLVPALPYLSSPEPVPSFFTGSSVSRIPEGSVALVVPLSFNRDGRAVLWQAESGMRFRMREGYAIVPGDLPDKGSKLSARVVAAAAGESSALTDQTRLDMLAELARWQVQTVIVGPMANEQEEVDLFTELLNQSPQEIDGTFVWWSVNNVTTASSGAVGHIHSTGAESAAPVDGATHTLVGLIATRSTL